MDIDILIIGGGPAGLSTALHLGKRYPHLTPRILLLEKERYPRFKLCAGGLTTDAEVILQRLGLDVTEIPHVNAPAAHFDFEGKGLKIAVPGRHTLRIIRRDEFDAWLAKKTRESGIEIREGITVKDLRPDENGVTVLTDQGDFRAQVVVGADGSNGVVRRCVLPEEPVHTARVLEVITPNPHRPEGHLPHIRRTSVGYGGGREGVAIFDFFPVPAGIAGYVWDFPTQVNGKPMRCWGVYDTNLLATAKRPPLKAPLEKEMARSGFNLADYSLQGYPIRWFSPSSQLARPRIILAGDAVGADPIFGEGISMALGYGAFAAQEIGKAFEHGDFSFHGCRRRLLLSPLGQTLVVRWLIAKILYALKWRWFQLLFWRTLKPVIFAVAWFLVLNWAKRVR